MINMTVCFILGNKLFGLHRGSLTPIHKFWLKPHDSYTHVPGFSPEGINDPLLASPNTLITFHFMISTVSLYWTSSQRQTQPAFTKSGQQPYHAPTPDSTRCHRAHECNDVNSYIHFQCSYTIIFHIIKTIMLTHQLACMNISFSIHISSHSF